MAVSVFAEASSDIGTVSSPPSKTLHLKSMLKAFFSFQYSIINPTKEEMRIMLEVSLSKRYANIIVCGVVRDRYAKEEEFKRGIRS